MYKAVLFDAYGTLFDVLSVFRKCETEYPGRGAEITHRWRQKELEYAWLRTAMGRYRPFSEIMRDALCVVLDELGLQCSPKAVESICSSCKYMDIYPETLDALAAFRPRALYLLTNGDNALLDPLAKGRGLDEYIEGIISADEVGVYKPSPQVYALGLARCGAKKEEILFISANGWDVSGAAAFGFATGWVNRAGKPFERLGYAPSYEARDLLALAKIVNQNP